MGFSFCSIMPIPVEKRHRRRHSQLVAVSVSVAAFCCPATCALAPSNHRGTRINQNQNQRSSRPYSISTAQEYSYPTLDPAILRQGSYSVFESITEQEGSSLLQKRHITQRKAPKSPSPKPRALYEADDIRLIRNARNAKDVHAALRSISSRFSTPPGSQLKALALAAVKLDIDIHIDAHPLSLAMPTEQAFVRTDELQFVSTRLVAAALRSLAHIQMKQRRSRGAESDKVLQAKLVRTLVERLFDTDPGADLHALSDIVDAFGILAAQDTAMIPLLQPLAKRVVHLMANEYTESDICSLSPSKLSHLLQGVSKLELDDSESILLVRIASQQITKSGLMSRTTPESLSYAMLSVATIASTSMMEADVFDAFLPMFFKVTTNGFRKQKIRTEASADTLGRAVAAVSKLVHSPFQRHIEPFACTFGYTAIRAIIDAHQNDSDRQGGLALPTITQLIGSWSRLNGLPAARENTIIHELFQILIDEPAIWDSCSAEQIERLLTVMAELRIVDQPEIIRIAGEKFREMAIAGTGGSFRPRTVNNILRCPTLLHRDGADGVLDAYLDATRILFRNETFLEKCRIPELANFLWMLSSISLVTEAVKGDMVRTIMQQILHLEKDISSTSPPLASRILFHATKVIHANNKVVESFGSEEEEHNFVVQNEILLQRLFYALGRQLSESFSLTPVELSSAIYAYSKAEYIGDMCTFEHLISLVRQVHGECSSRQLSQCLWACGKMSQLKYAEEQATIMLHPDEASNEDALPGYWGDAVYLAAVLSKRAAHMSTQDVAQSIWSLGRLQFAEPEIVKPLVARAVQCASDLSSVEVVNILWGLSKIRHYDSNLMASLVERITSLMPTMSPNDAGSILYSFGVLTFRHASLFELLTDRIRGDLDQANAHDIAHALLAHHTAKMPAPDHLLEDWAAKRLGLSICFTHDSNWRTGTQA